MDSEAAVSARQTTQTLERGAQPDVGPPSRRRRNAECTRATEWLEASALLGLNRKLSDLVRGSRS